MMNLNTTKTSPYMYMQYKNYYFQFDVQIILGL